MVRPLKLQLTAWAWEQVGSFGFDWQKFIPAANELLVSKPPIEPQFWKNKIKSSKKSSVGTDYPNLPLLVAFTLTATEMGTTGGFKTNAYYPRLKELIEIEDKNNNDKNKQKKYIEYNVSDKKMIWK